MRTIRGILAVAALVSSSSLANAQVVKSTFGAGDSYSNGYYTVDGTQSIAQSFVYTGGAGFVLNNIRMALVGTSSTYNVQFLEGASMNTATVLESWNISGFGGGITTLTSSGTIGLVNSSTYWIAAFNSSLSGASGWWLNSIGATGVTGAFPTAPWTDFGSSPSAAYDVSVNTAVPEPGTYALMVTGLIGVFATRRRRKA